MLPHLLAILRTALLSSSTMRIFTGSPMHDDTQTGQDRLEHRSALPCHGRRMNKPIGYGISEARARSTTPNQLIEILGCLIGIPPDASLNGFARNALGLIRHKTGR